MNDTNKSSIRDRAFDALPGDLRQLVLSELNFVPRRLRDQWKDDLAHEALCAFLSASQKNSDRQACLRIARNAMTRLRKPKGAHLTSTVVRSSRHADIDRRRREAYGSERRLASVTVWPRELPVTDPDKIASLEHGPAFAALASLPRALALAAEWKYMRHSSYLVIALNLGSTVAVVRRQVNEAKVHLRAHIVAVGWSP